MAKEDKQLTSKEIEEKLKELKIELLKQPMKRNSVKKAIARLLTVKKVNQMGGKK